MKKIIMNSVIAFAAAALVACGGSSSKNQGTDVKPEQKQVTGQLTMPDGGTPLADATVYVPDPTQPKLGVVARQAVVGVDCKEPAEAYVFATCTDAKGNFVLSVDKEFDLSELKAVKGKFELFIPIDETDGLDVGAVTLPTEGEGVPRMAVVQGDYDNIENVLAKTGYGEVDENTGGLVLGTETFDLFGRNDFYDVFTVGENEQLKLFDYDIVFVNCGVNEFHASPWSDEIREALREYVNKGGQLYVTDQAYDYVEQAFPEYIDFYGSDDTPTEEPEALNAAQEGVVKNKTYGNVLDPILLSTLKNMSCGEDEEGEEISCVEANDDAFSIQGMLGSWAVMLNPHNEKADEVKVWVEGEVSYGNEEDQVRPLTVSFNHGEGKVIYTSYHTDNSNNSVDLLPQERVLQFLVFE